ncbi:PAP/fibrillin family protein [Synechococcus sp. BA-132 BA5]|uniref:PAP/fibrillin family protein n=1 Tax=Synechococcus sp. BA-132 BA5 TaxID=3110252 RepID=UPI002B21B6E9|nr:PAP/fibrillin family protein [Synechococcus sp. BA-132 BA5]MEA5416337.1 PAP/fibrillin family protein [Synechococcus sp. BA-132 BA5]
MSDASHASVNGPTAPADGAQACREDLLGCLRAGSSSSSGQAAGRIEALIERLERLQPADLSAQASQLAGVWELRWSSSSLPYLAVQPWLENLQLLDPAAGRALNLLRLAGPLGPLAGIGVQARIAVAPEPPHQRVSVQFERGGWLGPRIGERRLQLFRQVKQSFPAWLDVTVLDDELRVSRGNAGTLFALVRRPDLELAALLS